MKKYKKFEMNNKLLTNKIPWLLPLQVAQHKIFLNLNWVFSVLNGKMKEDESIQDLLGLSGIFNRGCDIPSSLLCSVFEVNYYE